MNVTLKEKSQIFSTFICNHEVSGSSPGRNQAWHAMPDHSLTCFYLNFISLQSSSSCPQLAYEQKTLNVKQTKNWKYLLSCNIDASNTEG